MNDKKAIRAAKIAKYLANSKISYTRKLARQYKVDYKILLEMQKGPCELCDTKTEDKFYLDHCHKTNKLRGVLCQKCNFALGHLEYILDNNLLNKMIKYLNKK